MKQAAYKRRRSPAKIRSSSRPYSKNKNLRRHRRKGTNGELWIHHAKKAGFMSASQAMAEGTEVSCSHMQLSAMQWFSTHELQLSKQIQNQFKQVVSLAQAFGEGYELAAKLKREFLPLPVQKTSSAILCASNEEHTLPLVIAQLKRLPLDEIIVILNGCLDDSYNMIEQDERIIIVHYKERLGHDVGRSIGAKLATGNILLFLDGDLTIKAEQLALFMIAVNNGIDVALNDLSPFLPKFVFQDHVTRIKSFLNITLGRGDLGASSLTAVPHAISRKALSEIGVTSLMVPPKAQALAMMKNLSVANVASVDVVKGNRMRVGNIGHGNAVARLIIGDHVEALNEVMKLGGIRLKTTTLPRHELAKVRNQG
ncbi:hypothetical protein J2Z32_004444 [Paenibacillus turicensis]|uniref:Glycosyltransferase 2-like domain-containing protein n=1 Tax=Paenibacillus turicensis TaxID=160487 RepID=A0ABS4FYW3_9BACL|nr:glycosyltransferase family 2 protein [Paenibacillus turicensis]MBP1907763.1 hypothetical protein [Paenibacillus turicensis]